MAIPRSQIVRGSEAFKFDTQGHLAILDEVRNAAEMVAAGGSAASRQRHVARGKLLPRRRVSRLLDPGSPFLEIGAFAAHGLHDGASRGAGSIAGISRVEGVEAMVFCDDSTLRGGACCPLTVKKHPRAREIAAENNPRCIHVVGYGRAVAGLSRSRQARRLLADAGSPLCDPDEMPGLVPPDPRTPHDIREVNRADAVLVGATPSRRALLCWPLKR